ncbi:MAG: LysR family transcriptional regulator [Verrucomicrobiota bacterium]
MNELPWLNYQHLLYFRVIVQEGGVTKAAAKLRLSQSTLSAQLKTLEENLGAPLFIRERRKLVLTQAGQVAIDYAEEIFRKGDELRAWFAAAQAGSRRTVRVGALSPLSKNLQYEIIRPLIMESQNLVQVIEGEMTEMIQRLLSHQIDLLLSNLPPDGVDRVHSDTHLLGEMPVYLVGRPPFKIPKKAFPNWLEDIPLFLPSNRSSARVDFDALLIRAGVTAKIQAEVDDTALLRLLALSGGGLALMPEIGVKFELEKRRLLRIEKIKGLKERFYAITAKRSQLPSQVKSMIENGKAALERTSSSSRAK